MKKIAVLFLVPLMLMGCAMWQVDRNAVIDSVAEKAGLAAYNYLPEHRNYVELVCDLEGMLQGGITPLEVQKIVSDRIGLLWVQAGEVGAWIVQTSLNDLVRFSGLDSETPVLEDVARWTRVIGAFCGGVEIAKTMER